jgi:pimeloyl-ACP methyl ester carboxylesterase
MATITPPGATIPGVKHHLADLNGTKLHYVSAGDSGSPILLVHGWPETWWAFRKLIPLLAQTHRVFALDLRGFGDSSSTDAEYGEAVAAEDLHRLVEHIGAGPVHLLCQDVSGGTGFRFAATHPADVVSFIAVETTLAGFGLEALADVNGFGSWHVGFLGAPGIPRCSSRATSVNCWQAGRTPLTTGTHDAVTDSDMDEFVRTYARPNAWRGTEGLYQAPFSDNGATKALAEAHPIAVPVLAVDGASHPFTENTFRQVAAGEITAAHIQNVGHLVAQEAPEQLAAVILEFTGRVDAE